nr:immunoglobulin heavy chain junction region [Mus musculus]
ALPICRSTTSKMR